MDKEALISRWSGITKNIEKLQQKHAPSRTITLIAVSKGQNITAIEALLESGQRAFGENRIQEAQEKWPALKKHYPDIELHLIGTLQSNKVKEALALFDIIHTLDRTSLINAIAKELHARKNEIHRQFLVQVNTGEEPQKGGVSPMQLPVVMKDAHDSGVSVSGLMCVPPVDANPAPHFALLHTLAKHYDLPQLSMGMSGDYETAIRLGATHVRVGTAIFGERE